MKKIIIILLVFAISKADAQVGYTRISQRYNWLAGLFDALGVPAGGSAAFATGQAPRAGAMYYDSTGADSGLYVYSGLAWRLTGVGEVTQAALNDTAAAIRGDFPIGGITTLSAIGATPNANGATISGTTLNLQPADSAYGGVVTTTTKRWKGQITLVDKFIVTKWDASAGYYGVTINHPFSSSATVNGLRIGYLTSTIGGYLQSKKSDNTYLPLVVEGGKQVADVTGGVSISSYGGGLRLLSADSLAVSFNPPTIEPSMLYGLNEHGGTWKIKLGSNLMLSNDTLEATIGGSVDPPNTLYTADDSLFSSRIVDMRGRSLQFINSGLFRIEDTIGTAQGTYDFNKGIDFITYNTAKSLNIKADVINGIILKGRNISSGDSVYIQVNDSLRSVFNNFVNVSDSGSYYMQVINKTTGTHGKAWWPAGGGSQNLQSVTDVGNVTTDTITAAAFDLTNGYIFNESGDFTIRAKTGSSLYLGADNSNKWFINAAGELGEGGAGDVGSYTFQSTLGTSRFKDMAMEYETAPGTPSLGLGALYAKSSDKKLYWKDDAGTEYDLTASPNLLFDSLGASGISPVTARNDTLYSRRISISGGTIDTTATGGLLISVTGGGSGANTALSNLASVAINTSLISDADNTDDLGSSALAWKDAYAYTFKLKNVSGGITTFSPASSASNFTITVPSITSTMAVLGLAQTWTGNQTFSNKIYAPGGFLSYAASEANSNLWVPSPNGLTINSVTASLFEGSTSTYSRVMVMGNSGSVVGVNSGVASLEVGALGSTEAASGTHPGNFNVQIMGQAILQGGASTTEAASLNIDGPPTGTATITNPVNSLRIRTGNALFANGNLTFGTAGNKLNIATGTNASVGTSGAMTAGSITINTTAVTAGSIIILTPIGAGTGSISLGTITAGTSFVINSSDNTDTRLVQWWLIN